MAISNWDVSLTNNPLESREDAFGSEAGAVVQFFGVVRRLEDAKELEGIEYEAHRPMAEHQINLIAQKAVADFPLSQLVIKHRLGFVKVAEASLFLRIASPHRGAAFAASQQIIDELKRKVPIWKRPVFKKKAAVTPELIAATEALSGR